MLVVRNFILNFAYTNKDKKTDKIMRKFIAIVAAVIMTVTSVRAQDEQPRHEIGVSYGAGISLIGDGIGNGLTDGIFDAMNGRKWENSRELGTVAVEYFYHLNNPRLAVGGVVTYAFQLFKLLKVSRKLTVVLFHDLLRTHVQVAGARVVAEALPLL